MGSVGFNENIFTADFYAVAIHPHGWILADFASSYIVLPPMPGARHYVPIHYSLAQRPPAWQPGIADGIVLTTNVRQGDRLALSLEIPNRSRRNLIRLCTPRKPPRLPSAPRSTPR